jgi:hypothetical protein
VCTFTTQRTRISHSKVPIPWSRKREMMFGVIDVIYAACRELSIIIVENSSIHGPTCILYADLTDFDMSSS